MNEPDSPETDQKIEPKEWRFTIIHAFGLCILFAVLQLGIVLLIRQSTGLKIEELRWYHLMLLNGIPGTLVLAVGAYLNSFSVHDMLLGHLPDLGSILSTVIAILGIGILSSELNNILLRVLPFSSDTQLIEMLLKEDLIGVLITVGIVAPIVEELLFRGVILDGLRLHYKLATAAVASSVLFGLIHWDPIVSPQTFLLGLFLCWLRVSTKSLMLCVISHSLFNVAPFILIRILNIHVPGLTSVPTKVVEFQPLLLDVFGVLLLLAGIAGLKFSSNEQEEQQEVHQN